MDKCVFCGANFSSEGLVEKVKSSMDSKHLCFSCWFWDGQLQEDTQRGTHNWAVINGNHFVLKPKTDGPFQGFGGAHIVVKFHDGVVKHCENLWHQGEIPDVWRAMFPDNAEFITEGMKQWIDTSNIDK